MYSLKFQSYHAKAVPASPPHTFGSYWLGGRVRQTAGGKIVFNNKNKVAVGHHIFSPVLNLVEVGFKTQNRFDFCFLGNPISPETFSVGRGKVGRVYPRVRVRHSPPSSIDSLGCDFC